MCLAASVVPLSSASLVVGSVPLSIDCLPASVVPLSSDSLPAPANVAVAANTVTPFFFIRCATPWPSRPATLRDLATMAARSARASLEPVTP
ncbi:hypothetical protein D3C71_1485800 [compost metagenome]